MGVIKRRKYEFSAFTGTLASAEELKGRLFRRCAGKTVEVLRLDATPTDGPSAGALVHGVIRYTVVGNVPYDVRRMIMKAARGMRRKSGHQPIVLERVEVKPIGPIERLPRT